MRFLRVLKRVLNSGKFWSAAGIVVATVIVILCVGTSLPTVVTVVGDVIVACYRGLFDTVAAIPVWLVNWLTHLI
ncbi:hypothetical protein GCM10010174_25820 [Kutzneria viridogrisea]|uniref:Uncharacterized protein n=1 Tax=Kutzneria viridogrisea TaxID=47990 RepID=A0ABR6BRK2_9PSEU|nr:hypothetical protein [Kutzneria viridogrisea]